MVGYPDFGWSGLIGENETPFRELFAKGGFVVFAQDAGQPPMISPARSSSSSSLLLSWKGPSGVRQLK